jgi:hypothetical protein
MGGKLISRFAPISAIRTSAVLRSTPGVVSKSPTSSEKGALPPLYLEAQLRAMDSSR